MEKKINIHAFLRRFNEIYNYLYETENAYDARLEEKACKTFDEFLKKDSFCAMVSEFARFRGDAITSDREAAAYVLALDEMI